MNIGMTHSSHSGNARLGPQAPQGLGPYSCYQVEFFAAGLTWFCAKETADGFIMSLSGGSVVSRHGRSGYENRLLKLADRYENEFARPPRAMREIKMHLPPIRILSGERNYAPRKRHVRPPPILTQDNAGTIFLASNQGRIRSQRLDCRYRISPIHFTPGSVERGLPKMGESLG